MVFLDYDSILPATTRKFQTKLGKLFEEQISSVWVRHYVTDTPNHGHITWQDYQNFTFAFDDTSSSLTLNNNSPKINSPRVIGCFGYSYEQSISRSRMKGFPKMPGSNSKANYDKGHFIALSSGGPFDINLFPQRSDINRGGRFRSLEIKASSNPGTFLFSRPVYNDNSVCPYKLEYGLVLVDGTLQWDRFDN
jgi:hypothetical protein